MGKCGFVGFSGAWRQGNWFGVAKPHYRTDPSCEGGCSV